MLTAKGASLNSKAHVFLALMVASVINLALVLSMHWYQDWQAQQITQQLQNRGYEAQILAPHFALSPEPLLQSRLVTALGVSEYQYHGMTVYAAPPWLNYSYLLVMVNAAMLLFGVHAMWRARSPSRRLFPLRNRLALPWQSKASKQLGALSTHPDSLNDKALFGALSATNKANQFHVFMLLYCTALNDLKDKEGVLTRILIGVGFNRADIAVRVLSSRHITITIERMAAGLLETRLRHLQAALLGKAYQSTDGETASLKMGVCYYTQDVEQALVYQAAQSALALAKQSSSRDLYVIPLKEQQTTQSQNSGQINQVIEKGAFMVFFQPVYAFEDNTIVMHEAICRTRDEADNLLPLKADTYTKLADSERIALDKRIISHVLTTLEKERDVTLVSVNVQRASWQNDGFIRWLVEQLKSLPVRQRLAFEITESDLVKCHLGIEQSMERLNAVGGRIMLDNVRGVSDLSRLPWCLLSGIKLGQSLVTQVEHDTEKQKRIKQLVKIAQQHRVAVYAVGVESLAELTMLKKCGVEGAQGHYFVESLEQITALLHPQRS